MTAPTDRERALIPIASTLCATVNPSSDIPGGCFSWSQAEAVFDALAAAGLLRTEADDRLIAIGRRAESVHVVDEAAGWVAKPGSVEPDFFYAAELLAWLLEGGEG